MAMVKMPGVRRFTLRVKQFLAVVLASSMLLVGVPGPGPAAAEEQARVDYFSSSATIEYVGAQTRSHVRLASLIKSDRSVQGDTVTYRLTTEGGVRIGSQADTLGFRHGPVSLSRDPATEELRAHDPIFQLPVTVVNKAIRQVPKESRRAGTWTDTFNVKLGKAAPQELQLKFAVQPIELPGAAADTLIIAVESDPITFEVAEGGGPRTRYKGILVYSPSEQRQYQKAVTFVAEYGGEAVRIETQQFLTDDKGSGPLTPLVDVREALGWSHREAAPEKPGSLPVWVVQALIAEDVVDNAATTDAERSTNPVGDALKVLRTVWNLYNQIQEIAHSLSSFASDQPSQDFLKSFQKADTQLAKWVSEALGADPAAAEFARLLASPVMKLAHVPSPPRATVPDWLTLADQLAQSPLTARAAADQIMQSAARGLAPAPPTEPAPPTNFAVEPTPPEPARIPEPPRPAPAPPKAGGGPGIGAIIGIGAAVAAVAGVAAAAGGGLSAGGGDGGGGGGSGSAGQCVSTNSCIISGGFFGRPRTCSCSGPGTFCGWTGTVGGVGTRCDSGPSRCSPGLLCVNGTCRSSCP